MNRGFYNRLVSLFVFLSTFLWIASFSACSNKVLDVEAEGQAELADDDLSLSVKNSLVSESSSKSAYPSSFKPDDKEYPYAGIPRVVIETEYRQAINDRETEIPAKLQIWGENESESEIMDLTIRGRGYSSWDMKKKGYKIKFQKKQRMFGLSRDKEWNLIANYADKSLLRNYITYKLQNHTPGWFNGHYVHDDEITPFTDVDDINITRAYELGVVAGKGNNEFKPDDLITRQEAAVMLDNFAKVMGISPNTKKRNFSDNSYFAAWAKDAIYNVSATVGNDNIPIMTGTTTDKFSPWMNYTREQAYVTLYRTLKIWIQIQS